MELEKLRDHILIGEDIKDIEDLPAKSQQGLIIKEMQNKLVRGNPKAVLHKDKVFKQGKAASKRISSRFLIMTAKELMWFHSPEEYESGATALGIIKIQDIYKCSETLMQQGTYDFDIGFTNYIRKGQVDMAPRIMNFGCETENDRHNWISRIEFLRAKTVYENYVNKFVNIQFPLKKVDDFEDDSQQKNEVIFEKLNQFGKNVKQNVKVNMQTTVSKAQERPLGGLIPTYGGKWGKSSFKSSQKFDNSNFGGSFFWKARHSNLRPPESLGRSDSLLEIDNGSNSDYNFSQKQKEISSAKEMSSKVLQLYRASIIGFHYQTIIHANKSQYQNKKLEALG